MVGACPQKGAENANIRIGDFVVVDLGLMVTHRFQLDDIQAAYELFSHQRDGVLKVSIKP